MSRFAWKLLLWIRNAWLGVGLALAFVMGLELAARVALRTLGGAADAPLWDATHTTESGNERIARRIAEPLRELVRRRWAARRSGA